MPVYAYFDIIENQSTGEGCVVVEEEEPGEGFSQKNMFKLGDFISLVTYDLLAKQFPHLRAPILPGVCVWGGGTCGKQCVG